MGIPALAFLIIIREAHCHKNKTKLCREILALTEVCIASNTVRLGYWGTCVLLHTVLHHFILRSPARLQIKGRWSHAGTHDRPQPVDLCKRRIERGSRGGVVTDIITTQSCEVSVDLPTQRGDICYLDCAQVPYSHDTRLFIFSSRGAQREAHVLWHLRSLRCALRVEEETLRRELANVSSLTRSVWILGFRCFSTSGTKKNVCLFVFT